MSVVDGPVDFNPKQTLNDQETSVCRGNMKKILIFAAGVALAALLTVSVVVVTYMVYGNKTHEERFFTYDTVSRPHSASHAKMDFREENGGTGHEEIFINDVTREHTMRVEHPYYDIIILKKYNEGVEMRVVTTKPEEGKRRQVLECEETNMTNTEFVESAALLTNAVESPPEVTLTEKFYETNHPIKLSFKSCADIPSELFKEQECAMPVDGARRRKRQTGGFSWQEPQIDQWGNEKTTSYGNWGSVWKARGSPFPRCCDGCNHRKQCSALACSPPLDALDQASMDFTFCNHCLKKMPTRDIPHCDCISDLLKDIKHVRCPDDNYNKCYSYRSELRGIMASHKCWGRLVTKRYEVVHCGYKQTNCRRGRCKVAPMYCVHGKTTVRNNFRCVNYVTCEERTRQLSGGDDTFPASY